MLSQWTFNGLPVATAATLAAVLSAIVLALFLLRPRPQLRPVASLLLWERVLAGRPNPLWKELLLLALQLLVIVALTTASTAPRHEPNVTGETHLSSQSAPPTWHRLWVVDRSLSMSAHADSGATRIGQVRRQLLAELETLPDTVRAGVIGAGEFPTLLAPCSLDRSRVGLALRLLDDEGGPADLLAALRFAISQPQLHGEAPPFNSTTTMIELFTDDPLASGIARDFSTATGWSVRTRAPFDALPNVAITAFDLRGTEGIPPEEEGLVRLANHSPFTAEVRLSLETREAVLGEASLSLEPGGEVVRRYRFQPPGSGGVEAVLRDIHFVDAPPATGGTPARDGLAQDNRAFAWLEAVRPIEVVLVSPGNRYLDKVLSLIPGATTQRFHPDEYEARGRSAANQADIVFFDGWAPASAPPPRAFYIGPGAMTGAFQALGSFREPAITDWNHQHPVSRGLRLRDLKVALAATLQSEDGDQRLLGSPSGPVALARTGPGEQRAIAWAFDFGASDLPLRVAFPQLVVNAILWMRAGRDDQGVQTLRQPLDEPLWFEEPGASSLSILDLRAEAYGRAAGDTRAALAATRNIPLREGPQPIRFPRPGLFRLSTELSQTPIAVNIGDSVESNLQLLPLSDPRPVTHPVQDEDPAPPARAPWEWLALLGLGLLVLEFGVYTR